MDGLVHVQTHLADCADAKRLIAEADVGGRRRSAIRIFFESADACIAELMLPYNEAPPSVHQPGRAGFLEIIKLKCYTLVTLGAARQILVSHEDSGFFSAWLIVLDVLLMAPPEASVHVSWMPSGDEKHFSYADADESTDIWKALFKPVRRPIAKEENAATRAASALLDARGGPPVVTMDNTVFDAHNRSTTAEQSNPSKIGRLKATL